MNPDDSLTSTGGSFLGQRKVLVFAAKRWRWAAVWPLVVSLLLYPAMVELRHDDAFISFQFARNVAKGLGYSFNPGEPVFGATSPLHVLLLAAIYRTAGEILPQAAVLIGLVALGVQATFLFVMLRETSALLGWMVAGLVAIGGAGALPWLALETNLEAALVLAALYQLERRREMWCGALIGLAFLCRYDAALLVPIAVGLWWKRHGLPPWRLISASALVVSPWLVWATWYFGSFLPQTFHAKQHLVAPMTYLALSVSRFAQAPWLPVAPQLAALLAPVSIMLWLLGLLFVYRYLPQCLSSCLYGGGVLVAYSWIGPHPTQHWHLYFTGLTLTVLFVVGMSGWLFLSPSPWRYGRAAAAVMFSLLIAGAVQQTHSFAATYPTDFWIGYRHHRYAAISSWLRENVRPDAVMADPEIGTIGYLSELRMVDPYGLINPTNDFPREPTIENLTSFVIDTGADIVLVNSAAEAAFVEARSTLRRVKDFGADPWSVLLVRSAGVLKEPKNFVPLAAGSPSVP